MDMKIVEQGSGPPLVLIPGIQGRWEYVRPAVDALSSAFHVMTFPLCDEPSADFAFDSSRGFNCYVEQVRAALDQCGVERAVVCGISFGGLVALRFAAAHADRTCGLVLASTPGPRWHLRRRHEIYARLPYLLGPLFLAETPWRLRREMAAAFPGVPARLHFAGLQCRTLLSAPLSLARMAGRARMLGTIDAVADCACITVPTLIVTGERGLDYVVPVEGTIGYVSSIRGARGAVIGRTGHLGSITRPVEFAAIVRDFAATAPAGRILSGPATEPSPAESGLLSRDGRAPEVADGAT
jgi:pimeloyl-ACP methyl ester carboxylesterase